MVKHNYGLALSSSGEYQVIDTSAGAGVKDDYSRLRSEPFIFYVAPHEYIDKKLKIDNLTKKEEYHLARQKLYFNKSALKNLILTYHGVVSDKSRPSWSSDNTEIIEKKMP